VAKKRKPEAVAEAKADKALRLTDQKKKLKSLAGAVVGGLSGEKPSYQNSATQPNAAAKKRKKKPAAQPAAAPVKNPLLPPADRTGPSRAEKRAARRQEHFNKKKQAEAAN